MKLIKKTFTSSIILAFLINLPFIASLANVTYLGPMSLDVSTSANRYDIIITPVTAPNEDVVINGQPSDYTDPSRISIAINGLSATNYIPTNLFKYFPEATQVLFLNASVTTLVTDAFINCLNLETMLINYNPLLREIPARFAQSCTNLTVLEFYQNGIENIHPDALQGLTELSYLGLTNNKIKCIPSNLFSSNRKMYSISFGVNRLTRLNADVFANLPEMNSVTFYGNLITYLPPFNFFVGSLIVTHNPVQAIHPSFFTSYFSVSANKNIIVGFWKNPQCGINYNTEFELSRNNYTTYSDTCLACFNNYTTDLDIFDSTCGYPISTTTLSTSTLSTEDPSTVTSTPQNDPNEVLCATHKVCRYYLDSFDHYTCVIKGAEWIVTSISGAHFSNFGDENVTRIYFMDTQLSHVPNILFTKFINLNYLYIRNCSLSVINEKTFNMCGNLEFLDASFNEISHIAETSLRNCTKLKTIDVTGNPIDYLSTKLYDFDPSLKRIHLNRNEDFELA